MACLQMCSNGRGKTLAFILRIRTRFRGFPPCHRRVVLRFRLRRNRSSTSPGSISLKPEDTRRYTITPPPFRAAISYLGTVEAIAARVPRIGSLHPTPSTNVHRAQTDHRHSAESRGIAPRDYNTSLTRLLSSPAFTRVTMITRRLILSRWGRAKHFGRPGCSGCTGIPVGALRTLS